MKARKKKRRMTQAQLKRLYKRAGLEWKPQKRGPSLARVVKKHKLRLDTLLVTTAHWSCACGERQGRRDKETKELCIACRAAAAWAEYNEALIKQVDRVLAQLATEGGGSDA